MAHWIVANVCDSMFVLSAKRQTSGFIRAASGPWIQARLMLIFYEGQWDFWDPFAQNQTLRSNKKQMASPRMLQTNTHHIYHPPYIFDFIILFTSQSTVYIIAHKQEFWVKMTHLLKKNITSNHFLKFIFKLVSLVPHRYHVIKKKFIILIKFSIDNWCFIF